MGLYSILVDIAANTAKFESSLDKVSRQLENFGTTARRVLEFAGVATSIAEVVRQFDEFVSLAARLEHFSQITGMAVEEISQLRFAASQMGIGAEQMDTALERFAKNADAAATGSKKQATAFREMGISVTDASGHLKPMGELIREVADSFAAHADGPEKMALAIRLFGRAGAEMIPLLDQGRAGIEAYAKKLDDLGGTLKGDVARNAVVFEQQMGNLQAIFTGFKQDLIGEFLPAFDKLLKDFTEGASASGMLQQIASQVATEFRLIGTAVFVVTGAFETLGKAIGGYMAAVKDYYTHPSRVMQDIREVAADAARNVAATAKAIEDLWARADAAQAKHDENANKDKPQYKPPKDIDLMVEVLKHNHENIDKLDELYQRWNEMTETTVEKQANKFELFVLLLKELQKKGLIDAAEFAQRYNEEVDKLLPGIPEHKIPKMKTDTKEAYDAIESYADQAARSMQASFANFLFDPFSHGLRGMLVEFINILRRMVAEAVAAQLFKKLFGSTGDKSQGGSGLGDTLTSVMSSYFGGGMAEGGAVTGGASYLVGERGPEIFTPSSAGTITPNMGGGLNFSPTYHIDARGADADRVMTLVPAVAAQAAQQAKVDVLKAFRRSGLPAPLRA